MTHTIEKLLYAAIAAIHMQDIRQLKKRLNLIIINVINHYVNVIRSEKHMHEKFSILLSTYQIGKSLLAPMRNSFHYIYDCVTSSSGEEKKKLKQHFAELPKKYETLEERYALGEITKDIFDKVSLKAK